MNTKFCKIGRDGMAALFEFYVRNVLFTVDQHWRVGLIAGVIVD